MKFCQKNVDGKNEAGGFEKHYDVEFRDMSKLTALSGISGLFEFDCIQQNRQFFNPIRHQKNFKKKLLIETSITSVKLWNKMILIIGKCHLFWFFLQVLAYRDSDSKKRFENF